MKAIVAWLVVLVILLATYSYKTDEKLSASCVGPAPSAAVVGSRVLRRMGELVNSDPHPPAAIKGDVDKVLRVLRLLWWSLKFSASGKPMPPEILRLEKADDKRRRESPLCSVALAETNCANPSPGTPPADDWNPQMASSTREFSRENLAIARIAIREAQRAGLPERAAVVALAAGMQESGPNGPRNLGYGHSSSVGVWQLIDIHGTRAQRMDVAWSARWFYRQLKGVEGWENMSINSAAWRVERPRADLRWKYAQWEDDARRLVRSVGAAPAAPAAPKCAPADPSRSGAPADPGGRSYNLGPVKPETQRAANLLGHMFNVRTIGGVRNDAIPDHPSGRAIDLMVNMAQGQKVADYAQAHAGALSVEYIIWNHRIWSVGRAAEGWRPYTYTSNPHTDHVHITFTTGAPA